MAKLKVPVTKAGKDAFIEINTDDPAQGGDLPAEVYEEALAQGLKVLLNRGTTKITKASFNGDVEKLKAAAMEKAQEQLELMRTNKIRRTGAKSDKASGAVMTEARRIARNLVKDEMKRQKIKISYVDAKDITAAANNLIASMPEILEQAKQAIAERDAKAVTMKDALASIAGAVKINPKKEAAAEAEKAKAKEQLSKTQAGIVAKGKQPAKA